MLGDVAVGDRGPPCILDKADGSVVGGHLEVILIQSSSYLRKRKDPETGLALIDIA